MNILRFSFFCTAFQVEGAIITIGRLTKFRANSRPIKKYTIVRPDLSIASYEQLNDRQIPENATQILKYAYKECHHNPEEIKRLK